MENLELIKLEEISEQLGCQWKDVSFQWEMFTYRLNRLCRELLVLGLFLLIVGLLLPVLIFVKLRDMWRGK